MSKFLILPLSVAALAVLAACGSRQPAPVVVVPPQQPASTTVVTQPPATAAPAAPGPAVVQAVALRAGMGRIESMGPAPAASAGGTAASAMHRLNIRMDDGTLQLVDTPSPGLAIGDRVELTREGYIRRHPQ
jgi:hypothetical protein